MDIYKDLVSVDEIYMKNAEEKSRNEQCTYLGIFLYFIGISILPVYAVMLFHSYGLVNALNKNSSSNHVIGWSDCDSPVHFMSVYFIQ
jgi:hypothetical protein